ncbi:MAG TPA: antibiotic biosynthesis monooxygenase family protein [Caulobacteraceae bacterium]|jgi:heme-degrading monooxygenase HmoA
MSVTLINLFTVPPGGEDAFLARFQEMAARCEGLPGFVRTELHRNLGAADPTYAFVNVAVWESIEAWREGLPKILAGVSLGSGVIPKPGLYEPVLTASA